MKKIIALIAALVMALSLTACFGSTSGSSTADEAAADVAAYDKDFAGLKKYVADSNKNGSEAEIYYDILGADNGSRYIINNNAYFELYDFSKADSDTAKAILADIEDDGKFQPLPDAAEMTAVITKSGKYVLAWDASRSYDYAKTADKVKENW